MKKVLNYSTTLLQISTCLAALLVLMALVSCGKGRNSKSQNFLIALMSDAGTKDAYVTQMKGSIYTINPNVKVVDLDQDFQMSNLMQSSYLLDKSASSFPAGTIFIVAVEPGSNAARKPLLVHTKANKFYLGPDNGIFTHVIERELVEQVLELNNPDTFRSGPSSSLTYQGRDIFGPVAARLAEGADLAKLGSKIKEINRLKQITAATLGNKTNGLVIHVDRYGNIITNLRAENMAAQARGKLLKIIFKGRTVSAPFLEKYSDASTERTFCFINNDGEFEIAIREGNASTALALKAGDSLIIQN